MLLQFAIENGPVEIVDFPIKNGWIFPTSYVTVYQRVYHIKSHLDSIKPFKPP